MAHRTARRAAPHWRGARVYIFQSVLGIAARRKHGLTHSPHANGTLLAYRPLGPIAITPPAITYLDRDLPPPPVFDAAWAALKAAPSRQQKGGG